MRQLWSGSLLVLAVACGVAGVAGTPAVSSDAGTEPTITAVTGSGPATLAYQAQTTLTASVSGTGNFSPVVNWIVNSGGGHLSATTGTSVQYTAPLALDPVTVQIVAVSDADRTKTATISISITPAPPPEVAIAGTYVGDLEDFEFRNTNPRTTVADNHLSAQPFVVKTTGPKTATISGYLEGLTSCDIPITVQADGTFTFPTNWGCPQTCTGPGTPCPCFAQFFLNGSGTWDYSGNLSFLLHMDFSSSCGDVFGDETFTNGHT